MDSEIRFNHAGIQFAVKNVAASLEYYKKVLGFEADYLSGDPVEYAVVFRDEVYIHLCSKELHIFIGPGCGFFSVSGIELLWKHVQSCEIDVVQPLQENDYGQGVKFKDFTIIDPDKNVLRIGQPAGEDEK
jgi:hypothetical protein